MTATISSPASVGQRTLSVADSMRLLEGSGLPCAPWKELPSDRPVTNAALGRLIFPLAVKFDSPLIAHKTEAGVVVLHCANLEEVERARVLVRERALAYAPDARSGKLFVQQMASGVAECLIGLQRDPVVGPVILVGTGGVMVELFDDVAVRVLPLGRHDSTEMLSELKGVRLLEGFRGRPQADRASLEKLIRDAASFFAADELLVSVDLNPVIVGADGVWIVDAMIERRG